MGKEGPVIITDPYGDECFFPGKVDFQTRRRNESLTREMEELFQDLGPNSCDSGQETE